MIQSQQPQGCAECQNEMAVSLGRFYSFKETALDTELIVDGFGEGAVFGENGMRAMCGGG